MNKLIREWIDEYTDWYVADYLNSCDPEDCAIIKDGALVDYPAFLDAMEANVNGFSDYFYTGADFESFCEFAGYEFAEDEEEEREEIIDEWLSTKREALSMAYDKFEAALKAQPEA